MISSSALISWIVHIVRELEYFKGQRYFNIEEILVMVHNLNPEIVRCNGIETIIQCVDSRPDLFEFDPEHEGYFGIRYYMEEIPKYRSIDFLNSRREHYSCGDRGRIIDDYYVPSVAQFPIDAGHSFYGSFQGKKTDVKEEKRMSELVILKERTMGESKEMNEDEMDDFVSDESNEAVKDKSATGYWCHQCKKKIKSVVQCSKYQQGFCCKKYCKKCIRKHYKKEVIVRNKWECFYCRGICLCASCRRKRGEVVPKRIMKRKADDEAVNIRKKQKLECC